MRPKHHREKRPESTRKERAVNTSVSAWRALRLSKLIMNPMCQADGCNSAATEVDHVDGNTQNMSYKNLVSYCKPCHSRKTVAKDGGFGRKRG